MKKILLVCALTFAISIPSLAQNKIKIGSEVINGHLIPTIMINDQVVMKIQDKGKRGMFESEFDRAEAIYSALVDLEKKGIGIDNIRVRRNKSEYSAHVNQVRIFTVSNGDTLVDDNTPYTVARQWVDNIIKASNSSNSGIVPVDGAFTAEIADDTQSSYPLVGLVNRLSSEGFVLFFFQLLLFCAIQIGIAYLVFQKLFQEKNKQTERLVDTIQKIEKDILKLQQKQYENDLKIRALKPSPITKEKQFNLQ